MIAVFRLLFWSWLFLSMIVLILRMMNKRNGVTAPTVGGQLSWLDSLLGKQPAEQGGTRPSLLDAPPPLLDGAVADDPLERPAVATERSAPRDSTHGRPVIGARPSPGAPEDETAGSPPPGDAERATGAREGLFASAGTPSPDAGPASVATVAEALTGMTWPCGLTPVIDLAAQSLSDWQVAFSTTEAGAGEVGARLGDALEDLGYALTSLTDTTVEARRPDARLTVRLHPEAGKAERAGTPLFPSLPARAVVAVFTLEGVAR